ncbi:hypothetical protein SAMN05216227_100750 [Pseudorhodobacter antarcticus]|jgi:hypothetical protein|uniref:Uncharacterized protein n=1 Tax=Pseudorhodobacter antarcticus TaxID=1077947 RepID=A0A1H8DMR6_9RHOB|nr:hypothetical protein [Pseudorhodobacter antarcticus]SEN08074.1 hypothetical protein SAMN05216227_100750 [Pseudorhodobacter antarcticus]
MSAPNTNIERQKRRHKGPLLGLAALLIAVSLIFVLFLGNETSPDTSLLGEGAAGTVPADVTPTY